MWRLYLLGNAHGLFGWNSAFLGRVFRHGTWKGSKENTNLVILRSLAFGQFWLWSVKCWWMALPPFYSFKTIKEKFGILNDAKEKFKYAWKKNDPKSKVRQQTTIKYLHCTAQFFLMYQLCLQISRTMCGDRC